MKKILVVLIIGLFITVAIITLRPTKPIDKNLALAEELMSERPDSALQVLERLSENSFKGENEALYALLMTQAQFKNYISVNSDSLLKIAYDYYRIGKDSLRKAQVYLYKGRIDENIGRKDEAIKNYQKASIAALPTDNYGLLILIYNRWGLLLRKQHMFSDALIAQKKSLKYALLSKDTLKQVFILKDIGKVYSADQKYNQALSYFKRALRLAEIIKSNDCISDICNSIAILYKYTDKPDLGMFYLNKSISLLSDTLFLYPRYLLKGDILIQKQQFDSAYYYINLGRKSDMASEATYCSLMSKLKEEQGEYRKALSFSNKYISFISKIIDTDREKAIVELQRKYDYSLIKNENDKLKITRQQMQIVVLGISLIAIIATILFLYYFYRKRSIKRAMKMELDKMKNDLMNEKSNYLKEKTIEAQRNLIKEQELGLELSQKTEALKQHHERERELKDYIFQMDAIVQKINTFNSMKPLQRSKSESQFTLSFPELNDLEEAVNLCYDHFTDRLRSEFPKLKDDDIHLCCLLKMRVPNKNILSLLNTNELTLKKRRYRIKHDKMDLPEEVSSLEEFLLNY